MIYPHWYSNVPRHCFKTSLVSDTVSVTVMRYCFKISRLYSMPQASSSLNLKDSESTMTPNWPISLSWTLRHSQVELDFVSFVHTFKKCTTYSFCTIYTFTVPPWEHHFISSSLSDSKTSVSVSVSASPLHCCPSPQSFRWYMNTWRVVIFWEMSHFTNNPRSSASD